MGQIKPSTHSATALCETFFFVCELRKIKNKHRKSISDDLWIDTNGKLFIYHFCDVAFHDTKRKMLYLCGGLHEKKIFHPETGRWKTLRDSRSFFPLSHQVGERRQFVNVYVCVRKCETNINFPFPWKAKAKISGIN